MVVLITGCGGYIGSRLARTLRAQGHVVRALDADPARLRPLADLGIATVAADVADLGTLQAAAAGAEWVFHLAGSALGTAAAIRRTSVVGARNIAAVCETGSGVRALVFASSGALYPSGSDWLDEETPPAPAFGYARAKYLAEQELLAAHARAGVPVVIARIANAYGPDSPALMLAQVQRGKFPLIGGGQGYISSIHIDDLLDALLALATHGQPGRIYNLADDQPTTISQFYHRLAALLGAPPPPGMAPPIARILVGGITLLARLRRRQAPLPEDLVAMAAVSHRMCNRRMREELGVTLRYPASHEGLRTCVPGTPVKG